MQYMTARQAAEALGVTLPTLYAYTSRGQLHSEPFHGRPRERRYRREEVERLLQRKEARRDPAKAAALGLHWGSPMLSSGLTLIENGRLYYRGQDALKLSRNATLEEVAGLLWGAEIPAGEHPFRSLRSRSQDPLLQVQMALPQAGAKDPGAYDLRPAAVRQTGSRILRLMTAIIAGCETASPAHVALQAAWAPRNPAVAEAIRCALVLCADHELNVSAFTARCAASAGASPYDVVSAALATLKGSRHGGSTERVAALFDEAGKPSRARAVMSSRLRRGEKPAGFGHPLYPGGDPRAELLLRLAERGGNRKQFRLAKALAGGAFELLSDAPNLDFGLVSLARAYRLPEKAPLLLFAIGRTVGWIAHAIEQYASDELIRPRAHYTGPPPEPGT